MVGSLLLLSLVRPYQPDLIVWPVTLESFPADKQLFPPLVQHNPGPTRALIARYHLRLNPDDPRKDLSAAGAKPA